jgi:hypothetical protein
MAVKRDGSRPEGHKKSRSLTHRPRSYTQTEDCQPHTCVRMFSWAVLRDQDCWWTAAVDLSLVTPVGRADAKCLLTINSSNCQVSHAMLLCAGADRLVAEGFTSKTAERDSARLTSTPVVISISCC